MKDTALRSALSSSGRAFSTLPAMVRRSAFAAPLTVALLATPAAADPTLGIGISFSFGGGSSVQTGIGARLFSDDEEDSTVASLGIDYLFQSGTWRPTIGVAYLGDDVYLGLDLGYRLDGSGFDYGLSIGGTDTKKDDPAPVVEEEEEDDEDIQA